MEKHCKAIKNCNAKETVLQKYYLMGYAPMPPAPLDGRRRILGFPEALGLPGSPRASVWFPRASFGRLFGGSFGKLSGSSFGRPWGAHLGCFLGASLGGRHALEASWPPRVSQGLVDEAPGAHLGSFLRAHLGGRLGAHLGVLLRAHLRGLLGA